MENPEALLALGATECLVASGSSPGATTVTEALAHLDYVGPLEPGAPGALAMNPCTPSWYP